MQDFGTPTEIILFLGQMTAETILASLTITITFMNVCLWDVLYLAKFLRNVPPFWISWQSISATLIHLITISMRNMRCLTSAPSRVKHSLISCELWTVDVDIFKLWMLNVALQESMLDYDFVFMMLLLFVEAFSWSS